MRATSAASKYGSPHCSQTHLFRRQDCTDELLRGLLAELAADAIRDALKQAGVAIEDLPQGVRWKLVD